MNAPTGKVIDIATGTRQTAATYPRPSAWGQLKECLSLSYVVNSTLIAALSAGDRNRIAAALEAARRFCAANDMEALQSALKEADAPASNQEIATQLAATVAAFPNAGKTDLSIYGRMLAEDVAATCPSRFVLYAGCHQLRTQSAFLPTIRESIEAFNSQAQIIYLGTNALESLPRNVQEAEDVLAQPVMDNVSTSSADILKAERDIENCRWRLATGRDTTTYPNEIIAAATVGLEEYKKCLVARELLSRVGSGTCRAIKLSEKPVTQVTKKDLAEIYAKQAHTGALMPGMHREP
jgi:hypothetical protein